MVSSRPFFLFVLVSCLGCLTGGSPSHSPSPPLSSNIVTNTGPPSIPDIVSTEDADETTDSDIPQVIPDTSGPFDIEGRNWDYGSD